MQWQYTFLPPLFLINPLIWGSKSPLPPYILLPPQIVKPKGKKLLRELLELKKITRISQYSTIYTTVHTRKKNYVRGSIMKNNYETSLHSHHP